MELREIELTEYTGKWNWKIQNFTDKVKASKPGEKILSPEFGFEDRDKWYIACFLNGQNESKKGKLGLFLHCKKTEKLLKTSVEYEFTILTTNLKKNEKSSFRQFDTLTTGYGFNSLMNLSDILDNAEGYLLEDCLTISCKITKSYTSIEKKFKFNIPESQRFKNLNFLIKNQGFGDVITLKIGAQSFRIYKGLLTDESPVFTAMFENTTTIECQSNSVKIEDMDVDVCLQMIEYLKTGSISNKKINLVGLLTAADKYQMKRLKALCEEALFEDIAVDYSVDKLILADIHNAQQLRAAILDYMVQHINLVAQTEGFKSMEQTHPQFGFDLVREIVNKIQT